MHVATGQSEGIETRAVIEQVLEQCERQLGGRAPDIALLFCAGDFDHQLMLDTVAERFADVPLIGGQVAGAMCTGFGYTEDSVRLVLLSSDELTFTVGVGRECHRDHHAAAAAAVAMARRGHSEPEALCLTMFNVFSPDEPTELLDSLNRALAPGCPVFGGATVTIRSDTLDKQPGSVQYHGREVLTDSMPIALISGPLSYSFSIENSWTPVGERYRVTEANGRWVQRIGERTPLALYQHYLGQHQTPAQAFPLAVFETDEHGHERYYMRVPLRYDRDTGSVLYSGPIPEGATVQLTEAVRTHMLEQTRQSVAAALQSKEGVTPVLCVVFSCAIRRQILGTQTYRESALITEQLDACFGAQNPGIVASRREVPMVGMYGASEISPLFPGHPSMLHQATMITLLIGVRGQTAQRQAQAPAPVQTPRVDAVSDQPMLLARRLHRANALLTRMEEHRELNNALLRTISLEIEQSKQVIAAKNRELRTLYAELAREKQKSDDLLLEILPREVAEELKRTGQVEPVFYQSVSVLFADFKGFTRLAASLSPPELLRELDYFFSEFDSICDQHGLEKLKTIGDAYMCAGGIPAESPGHARAIVAAAWHMQSSMAAINAERSERGLRAWPLRVGINTGPLMAGVIGKRKFAYDIWGNTVNIAARMESAGEPGRINVSQATYDKIRAHFACSHRGRIPVKNAGEVDMYFVDGPLEINK